MTIRTIDLPQRTDCTKEGPQLELREDRLTIRYDCAPGDQPVSWSSITFSEVLAVNYLTGIACDPDQVLPPGEAHVVRELSGWARGILKKWEEAVGWQDYQRKKGGRERFQHYRVYFDDVCCVEVVAADIQTSE